MDDIRELYILCEPIDTRVGKLHFLKVKDYPKLLKYSSYLMLDKQDIINAIKSFDEDLADYLSDLSMIEIIRVLKNTGIYEGFRQLFKLCFKKDVLDLIEDNKEFEYYRELIKKINCVNFEKPNPNPEIERFNRFKRFLQAKKGESISFEAIYTSVWVGVKQRPKDMYIYEMYALFNRIAQFKQYDATTLFATISSEVKIEPWYKHIDILKKDEKGIRTNLKSLLSSQQAIN